MNILLLGTGGRENAIARAISKSSLVENFYASKGNPGIGEFAHLVDLKTQKDIADFCFDKHIDVLVVGPEQPLVEGIHDYICLDKRLQNVIVVGPKSEGAKLEGSKDFAKHFMQKYNIPTAKYKTFTKDTLEEGRNFLSTISSPYVLKADGLAAGKGVLIINDLEEAKRELESMLVGAKFGDASSRVIIEEFLSGVECSVFVLTDGKHYVLLPEAKDYKRAGEKDTGLNTGGMGSISPVGFCDEEFMNKVKTRIIEPTISGLIKEGIEYQGFIFFGLMNVKSNPYVIEYNVRMGDPESESVFARLDSDLVEAFVKMGQRNLDKYKIKISENCAATVMLCSKGYPVKYEKGKNITIYDNNAIINHAGTKFDNGNLVTDGGRVMALTCMGKTLDEALKECYKNVNKVAFEGKYYRKDIGKI